MLSLIMRALAGCWVSQVLYSKRKLERSDYFSGKIRTIFISGTNMNTKKVLYLGHLEKCEADLTAGNYLSCDLPQIKRTKYRIYKMWYPCLKTTVILKLGSVVCTDKDNQQRGYGTAEHHKVTLCSLLPQTILTIWHMNFTVEIFTSIKAKCLKSLSNLSKT